MLTNKTDEMGSTGATTQTLSELLNNSNLTSNSSKEFISAVAEVVEIVEEVTEKDYILSVYLYDMEENIVACATLNPANMGQMKRKRVRCVV